VIDGYATLFAEAAGQFGHDLILVPVGVGSLAALRALVADTGCSELRRAARLGPGSRVLLVATEGPPDPATYRRAVAGLS
jgi:threonine dehydratase